MTTMMYEEKEMWKLFGGEEAWKLVWKGLKIHVGYVAWIARSRRCLEIWNAELNSSTIVDIQPEHDLQ